MNACLLQLSAYMHPPASCIKKKKEHRPRNYPALLSMFLLVRSSFAIGIALVVSGYSCHFSVIADSFTSSPNPQRHRRPLPLQ